MVDEWMDRQTDVQIDTQMGGLMDWIVDGWTDRQLNGQVSIQEVGRKGGKTERKKVGMMEEVRKEEKMNEKTDTVPPESIDPFAAFLPWGLHTSMTRYSRVLPR